jgi:hypothetical protein
MKFQEIVQESLALTQVSAPSPFLPISALLCFAILRVLIIQRSVSSEPQSFGCYGTLLANGVSGIRGREGRVSRWDHKCYLNEREI